MNETFPNLILFWYELLFSFGFSASDMRLLTFFGFVGLPFLHFPALEPVTKRVKKLYKSR